MKRSAIVVAHADDEILWLSTQFRNADKVIVCFGQNVHDMGTARAAFFKEQPYEKFYCLGFDEPSPSGCVDWNNPILTPTGIKITNPALQEANDQTFVIVKTKLQEELADIDVIYTHNPWGESGHPHHILIHRAVTDIAEGTNKKAMWSNYVSLKSAKLAGQILVERTMQVEGVYPTDKETADELMALYKKHGIWTWDDDYIFPDTDIIMTRTSAKPTCTAIALNMIEHDPAPSAVAFYLKP